MLLRDNYDRVYGVCRRLTGNDTDACDAAQEALIAIVRGLARFDGRSQLSTWVYRIAVNSSIDEMRRRGRRSATSLDALAEGGMDASSSSAFGSDALGETVARGVDIDVALMKLPADFRAAVVLRDMCGLDYQEISEVLGIPPGTVRSRIARGRSALAELLGPARSGL